MTCEACAERRRRLKAWIRKLLGIDEILTKQGRLFASLVNCSKGESSLLIGESVVAANNRFVALEQDLDSIRLDISSDRSEADRVRTETNRDIAAVRKML